MFLYENVSTKYYPEFHFIIFVIKQCVISVFLLTRVQTLLSFFFFKCGPHNHLSEILTLNVLTV